VHVTARLGLSPSALFGAALFGASLFTLPPAAAKGLELRRLVLYQSGVGYYEREGRLEKNAVAEIPLEPGQLDDVLKTAVVLSDDGVAALEYDAPVSRGAARAEAGLSEDGEETGLEALLRALRGAEVAIARRSGPELIGRLVAVETSLEPTPRGAQDEDGESSAASEVSEGSSVNALRPIPRTRVSTFGPRGLQVTDLRDVTAIRPRDEALASAWDRALRAGSTQPVRAALRVRGTGAAKGSGKVVVGYTTEAPVWRTTYRLVVSDARSRVQAFALVHNGSDEPWRDLAVTLVSGRPQSFLYPLAVPRYARRELVTPDDGLEVSPQLLSQDVREQLSGSLIGDSYGIGGLGTIGHGGGGGGYGSGSGSSGTTGRMLHASALLADGPGIVAPAAVSEAGDLFLYTVMAPVTLSPRSSALLPIIDGHAESERVTVLTPQGEARHGVRLVNSTKLTLEAGTVTVYTDGAFAGETQLDRVKPKEVRVLAHGVDLDVEATVRVTSESGPARKIERLGAQAFVLRDVKRIEALALVSRSERPRVLLVELGGEGHGIEAGATEDVRSPGQPRYGRVSLAAREKKAVTITESARRREAFDVLDVAVLDALLLSPELDEASRRKLRDTRPHALAAKTARAVLATADARRTALDADVTRLRASITATSQGGPSSAAEALGDKLVGAEEALDALAAERARAESDLEAAKKAALDTLE
jgi:hypothetical protein